MIRRPDKRSQLTYLFHKQHGKCAICNEPAVLDYDGGKAGNPLSAVRFRVGSSFGNPGRTRPRVMAHRKCSQERSAQIEASVPIEELQWRARRHTVEVFSISGPLAHLE